VTFAGDACGFAYRRSRFNEGPDRGRYIVTRVDFALSPGAPPRLDYADLRNYFAPSSDAHATPTLAETSAAVRAIRAQKAMVVGRESLDQRDPDTRSAGSFFKNPMVPESVYQAICTQFTPKPVPSYPGPPASDGTPQRKLLAAWLLEHAGFAKGFRLGGAALSSRHTLALTNHSGHASAEEILKLRDTLVAGVEAKFGVRLQAEPVFVE
jgi:UDP-N-acetylmuramate dehydrogenase